jgi:hypothetical protein
MPLRPIAGCLGTKDIMTKKAVVKLYYHLTGGVDSGLNELDVLNYWKQHSIARDKILAFASIDLKNHTHIQQAIQIFGGVYLGFQVQENCVQEFDNHQPWTPGPLTNDGHAVFAVAYDQVGVTVLTWGNTQQATWAWWDECVDEAYATCCRKRRMPTLRRASTSRSCRPTSPMWRPDPQALIRNTLDRLQPALPGCSLG